jgi:hypothetical protein
MLQIDHLPKKHKPADANPLLMDVDGNPPDGTYSYSSVVGMLQYLQAHSRPYISFAVSQCAWLYINQDAGQYLKATLDEHTTNTV